MSHPPVFSWKENHCSRSRRIWPWLFFSVLAVGHILAIIGASRNHWGFAIFSDAPQYQALAQNMLQSHCFSMSTTRPLVLDSVRTPGYPAFLAACYVLDNSPVMPVIVQTFGVLLLAGLLWYWADRRGWGSMAYMLAFLVAGSPVFMATTKTLMSESLAMLFVCATMASLWYGITRKDNRWLVVSGLLTGGLILLRPTAGIFIIPAVAALGWEVWRQQVRLRTVFLWLVIACLGPVAWIARNAVVFDAWSLTSLPSYQALSYEARSALTVQQLRSRYSGMHLLMNVAFLPALHPIASDSMPGGAAALLSGGWNPPMPYDTRATATEIRGAGFALAPARAQLARRIITAHKGDWMLATVFGWMRFWGPPRKDEEVYLPASWHAIQRLCVLWSLCYTLITFIGGITLLCWSMRGAYRAPARFALAVVILFDLATLSQGGSRYRQPVDTILLLAACAAGVQWLQSRRAHHQTTVPTMRPAETTTTPVART